MFLANDDAGFSGPASAHHVLLGLIYERLGPISTADVLDAVFASSDDVGALAFIYVDLARGLGVIMTEGRIRHGHIPADRLPRLGTVLLPKIMAASEKTLTALPHYYEVARAWEHLGAIEAPRAWLAREARRDGHSLAKLSRGLLGTSIDGTRTRYGVYSHPETDIYDVDAIADGCKRFADAPDLTDTDRDRIAALREGLDRLRRRASVDDSEQRNGQTADA